MTTITAILPAFNEEISIGSIILRTRQHADRMLVIDDGSTDRTSEVAELADRQIAQRFTGSYAPSGPMTPQVIRHQVNRGKGAALRTGFEAAGGADIIITMDTDGQHSRTSYWRTPYVRVTFSSRMQHDPAEILKLIAPIQVGEANMVNGSRYIGGNGKNTPAYRRVGQKVLEKMLLYVDTGKYYADGIVS